MKSYFFPVLVPALLSLASATAVAGSYQSQTDVNYGWADVEGADLSSWNLKQRFYLAPVQTEGAVPLAEAAFMQRQASLHGTFSRDSVEYGEFEANNNSWSVGGEYMDSRHDFYASLDWRFINNSKEYEATTKLGFFVQNDWLVTGDIYHVKDFAGSTYLEYGASTKKLLDLDTGDFIAITAGMRNYNHSTWTGYNVGADYYFGKNLSVGLGYDWNSKGVFQTEADAYELRSQWFALPNLALNASLKRVDYLDDEDETLYQVGGSYRF